MSNARIPYESATSGMSARAEIQRILMRFGCSKLGFMDEFESKSLLLAFEYRGRKVQVRASAQGWANLLLRERPWTSKKRTSRQEYEERALEQGQIAINSILRDWIKGQITAIETGILQFDHVFLPYTLLESGQTVARMIEESGMLALPAPESE